MFFLRLRLPEFCVILSEQTYVLDGDIMLIQENLSVQEKLKILTDAAKYDVACTSSGVRRKGKAGSIGNTSEAGICHSFSEMCIRDRDCGDSADRDILQEDCIREIPYTYMTGKC